jgi:shikimate kinase
MKTIFIYGAPAAGKLTVATELAKLTGYSIIHNHLINDLILSVAEIGTPEFWEIARSYRLDLMERAARGNRKGIILTWIYGKSKDDAALKKIVLQARKHDGQIMFIHLAPDQKELFKRIKGPSRKAFHKVKTAKTLKVIMKRSDIFSEVPYEPNFVIDNSKVSARKTAKLIQEHYRLY